MARKATTSIVRKIYPNGRTEEVNEKMDLQQMQEFVGGYVEMVPSNLPHRALIVNENGLLDELPHNPEATKLVNPRTLVLDMVRGNALLVKA